MTSETLKYIKAENIRHLLGEMIVFGQRTGSADDVTITEEWNVLPYAVRQWMLDQAKANLPKLIDDTNKQANDRIERIRRVVDQLKELTSLDAETIPEQPTDIVQCGPFAEPTGEQLN
jgi:hypothetical protein